MPALGERVGVNYGEVPPVPIPNTEVKLISADDTWLETARENRSSPTFKRADRNGQLFYWIEMSSRSVFYEYNSAVKRLIIIEKHSAQYRIELCSQPFFDNGDRLIVAESFFILAIVC